MLFSFKGKPVGTGSSLQSLCVADPSQFVSGFWSPKGDELIAQFSGGMVFAMKADEARRLFVLRNGSNYADAENAKLCPELPKA